MISPGREVEDVLKGALPHLSVRGQTILDAVRLAGGTIGSTAIVARRLGLANRFALARMLQHDGLPGLPELAAWVGLLAWVAIAERSDTPLFVIAVRWHKTPAVCYRTVKRLTGLTWMQLRERGWEWVLRRFLKRCRVVQPAEAQEGGGRYTRNVDPRPRPLSTSMKPLACCTMPETVASPA